MSTPEPIIVTQEMRKAVYAADCEEQGHQPDFQNTLGGSWGHYMAIGGPDEQTVPHVKCARCGVVWLVWPNEFASYEDAVAAVKAQMKDAEALKPRPWSERSRQLYEAGGAHAH